MPAKKYILYIRQVYHIGIFMLSDLNDVSQKEEFVTYEQKN